MAIRLSTLSKRGTTPTGSRWLSPDFPKAILRSRWRIANSRSTARQSEDDGDRMFLHRGIAARQFQRSFALGEGVDVTGANMENGLLNIDLSRAEPEKTVQTIKINQG